MKRLFFVYGSLKKGYGNHRLLQSPGVKFLGEHITTPEYKMVSLGGFPAVICEGKTAIHGEVYEVTSEEVVKRLYGLEGFSGEKGSQRNFYDIEDIETQWGKATMFVFGEKYRARNYPLVESGKW